MKRLARVAVLASVCLAAAGCFPLSLAPLYTGEGDVIYDPALLGDWHVEGEPDSRWSFEPVEAGDAYIVRGREGGGEGEDDGGSVAQLRGVLVRVGDRRFLDLFPIGHEPELHVAFRAHVLPTHSIWRVGIEENRLRFALPDLNRVADLLQDQPGLVAHRRVPIDPEKPDSGAWFIFTADSAAFQAFVRDHLDDSFFTQEIVLVPAD